jgi:drug/metabolite transporter (DMT)-like permease
LRATQSVRVPQSLRGSLVLILVTAFWGSSFVIIKLMLPGFPASMINIARFVVATIVLLPWARRDRRVWIIGAELAVWLFAGYASQSIGLRYTTVNRSAFITAMNVIFVPILSRAFGGRIRPLIWAAAITALAGCGLLSYDGAAPNIGDLWSLVTAITYAIYIVRIGTVAKQYDALPLALAQLVPVVLLNALWVGFDHPQFSHLPWAGVIYLGLAATAATTWLQAVGQQTVLAAQAAVIYTLEPVFAAIFGFMVLHESLGPRGFVGAALILLAAITSQIPAFVPSEAPR